MDHLPFIFVYSLIVPILMLLVLAPLTAGIVFLLFALFLIWKYSWDYWYRVFKTQPRDLDGLFVLIAMRWRCFWAFKRNWGIQRYWQQTVKKYGSKEAIYDIALEQSFSFDEVEELSNQYANLLLSYGIKKNEVVGILIENGVHFVAAWLACCKIGAVSAWMNTNLRRQPLAHLLNTANLKTIICSYSLQEGLSEVFQDNLLDRHNFRVLLLGKPDENFSNAIDVGLELYESSGVLPVNDEEPDFQSPFCYIYTSGTTGLPKAAVIKHFRFFYIATGGELAFGIRPKNDKIYIALPLYHTSAGILGMGQTILHGGTCVIRKKFSARAFWSDCVRHECTVSQYIGELLRYLLLTRECPHEKSHKVRLLIGNGLRPAIWRQFKERFGVERIAEFYGSTEGTTNLVNLDGTEGSCGFMTIASIFIPLYPIRLFKVNEHTGELIKDNKGYCIPIEPGETGALVCTIKKDNPLLHFEGYLNKTETNKKIVENPLPGNSNPVFFSGDLLFWDKLGYLFFKDRIGDTFRWKGENVSTTEVESILHPMPEIEECTVYGIELDGFEGRCGMAAVVPVNGITVDVILLKMNLEMKACLPSYAVPLFVRILPAIDKTGTFKMKKTDLLSQGLSPFEGSLVYYLNCKSNCYEFMSTHFNELLALGVIKV